MNATKSVGPVGAMTMRELAAMTRDQVNALSPAEREARRERMRGDRTVVTLTQIDKRFGSTGRNAAKWRGNYLKTGEVSANALIAPMNEDDPTVRKPGDGLDGKRNGAPLYYLGDVLVWGEQGERLDEDYFPIPGGRKPPGRPPGSKAKTGPKA